MRSLKFQAFCHFSFPLQTAKNLSSSPQSARSSSTVGCPLSTTDSLYGEPLPVESTSSYNLPQAEESETTDETIHESQSQSTSQVCESHVYNVVVSMHVPSVFIHPHDENYESEDSNKPEHSHHPQDDIHPEIAAQVPFEFCQHSLGRFSNAPYIQEEGDLGMKDVLPSEIDEREINVVEGKTEAWKNMLEESVPPPFPMNDHTTEDVCSLTEALQHPLETGTQQEVEFVSVLTAETSKTVKVMLTVEEMDGLVASCLEQDRETHSAPICTPEDTSDLELNVTHEEAEEDPNNSEQGLVFTSNHQTTQETSEQASVSETSSPFAFYPQPSTVLSSTEKDFTCQGDERFVTALQDSETTLPLPRETSNMSTISKNEPEVVLERCVTASFTFFSAAVCLAVGIQEPSIFLVVGLFLLSLCF